MSRALEGRTMFISGASRGIGLAIARRVGAEGANVCLMAKTDVPDPRLRGTVHTAVAEIEAAGGRALGIVGDIRDQSAVDDAVAACVERFGGVDVCVNNASAIALQGVLDLPTKRFDLMQDINVRGTYVVSRACLPHLLQSDNPHVLTLSPPLSPDPAWYGAHVAYTMAKYAMSMCALGIAEEFRDRGVASNGLWPRTMIQTAAVEHLVGVDDARARARTPEIMADAAHAIITSDARVLTGRLMLDEDVLRELTGRTDFAEYLGAGAREDDLNIDLFVSG